MPRLNADSRQRALGNLEAGMVARQVARAFGVHVYLGGGGGGTGHTGPYGGYGYDT